MDFYRELRVWVSESIGFVDLSFHDRGWYAQESNPDSIIACLHFVSSGEVREQTISRSDLARVRESTIRRRLRIQGYNATPHTLVKP